ncbi:MAG: hypothetical protein Q8R88_02165 [Desulfoprunum sp.]|nr:hypothetical protein [Desulfoprunum sp.]
MIINRNFIRIYRSQRGAALLIMMLLLFIVSMAVLLKGIGKNTQLHGAAATSAALAKAKDALIAYAVMYADNYPPNGAGAGHLMCPDTDSPAFDVNGLPVAPYGSSNSPCGPNAIGRLPHSITLPSGSLFPLSDDGSGIDQQFWYAVTDAFIATPNVGVINTLNSTTPGSLTLDGQGDVVAVIIAPGSAVTGQNRPSRNAADYLEAGNVSGPDFVTNYPTDPDNFNDKVLALRRSELMPLVTARVAEEMKKHIDAYHVLTGAYPTDQATFFTAAFVGAPQWLSTNNWLAATTTTYTQISSDSATLVFNGCGIIYTLTFGTTTLGRSQTHC